MKRHYKKLIPYLAYLGIVVIVAAIMRAVSIMRESGGQGIQVQGPSSFLRALWLELKQAVMFSRY